MDKPTTDPTKEHVRIARAAGVVGFATFLSRIFGFLRDMVVAGFFGAGIATDAFFVAFRIPNLLRRLLAEGALTIAFVPVFTEYLKTRPKKDAFAFAGIAFTLLSIVLVAVTLAGILLSPWIVRLIAPGFTEVAGQYDLAVFLTRLMFPYIFFVSLVALAMGILNSLRHFAAPALAPVALNLSMIFSVFFLARFFREPIVALAVGVLAGGFLQLVMQIPFLLKFGIPLRPDFHFRHPGVRKVGLLMLPAVFGAAVYQINIFVGTLLASLLPSGSVSYLYYADRIVELPLGIFGIAVGTAVLPSLSAHAADGAFDELRKTVSFSTRLILFVTLPAMVALVLLRVPIISVLFQRGEFDLSSTLATADALLYYTLGLWAFSVIRVVVSAFYSLQDTKTPVKVAFLAFLVNVAVSVALMFPMKHSGLALATSVSTAVNVGVLAIILKKRIGPFFDAPFYRSLLRMSLAALAMGAVIVLWGAVAPWDLSGRIAGRLFHLAGAVVLGGVSFFVFAHLFRCDEMIFLVKNVKRKLGRTGGGA